MNSTPTSKPSAAHLAAAAHLALHPQDLAVELQREVVDGADVEGGERSRSAPPRLRSSSRAGTWARAVPVRPSSLMRRRAGARDRGTTRGGRGRALRPSRTRRRRGTPGLAGDGCSTSTTLPRRSTVTWARFRVMSHCESMARGVAISRQAPSSDRATTLKSAKTVARPPVRPSSRTRGCRRRSSSSRAMAAILGAALGAVKALLYSLPSSCGALPTGEQHAMAAEKPTTMTCRNCGRPLAAAGGRRLGVRVRHRVCSDPGLLRGVVQAGRRRRGHALPHLRAA